MQGPTKETSGSENQQWEMGEQHDWPLPHSVLPHAGLSTPP